MKIPNIFIPNVFRRSRTKRSPTGQELQYVYSRDPHIGNNAEEPYTITGKCMNVPAFAETVDYISDMMASMPVKLYHRAGDKIVEKADDRRIILLNVDTKSGMSGYQFKKRMIKDYLLYGGGYAAIRKSEGKIDGLFYVVHRNISISNIEAERLFYRPYKIRIGASEFEPYQFLKVLRDSKNGVSGTGMVKEFEKVLFALYQALEYTRVDAAEGGVRRGLVTTKSLIAPDTKNKKINTLYNNLGIICSSNKRHLGVFDGDLSFDPIDDGYIKQDLTERLKMVENSVRRLFHIKDDFYETFREAVFPIIKAFEAALNMDLLSTEEQAEYFFEVDTSEVLKANIKERYDAHKTAIEAGIKTINEVRESENLEKIKGLDVFKVGLQDGFYKDGQIYVVNTGRSINLTSQSKEEEPEEGGEKNDRAETI